MCKLTKIKNFLDKYLRIDHINDTCWNGLQFEGRKSVKKMVFAVDAGLDTFKEARSSSADLIVVHHGHFLKSQNPSINNWAKKRIDILYENEISLYACHLPLDRHKVVGNNAQIIKLIGAAIKDEFLFHGGKNIGWVGEFGKALNLSRIEKKLNDELGSICTVLPFGKEMIKTVAVCSGGGGYDWFYDAMNLGVDLYITGDAIEIFHSAKDSGMNVIFGGHHTTETIGLKALEKVIRKKFDVDTEFIDLPTGL